MTDGFSKPLKKTSDYDCNKREGIELQVFQKLNDDRNDLSLRSRPHLWQKIIR